MYLLTASIVQSFLKNHLSRSRVMVARHISVPNGPNAPNKTFLGKFINITLSLFDCTKFRKNDLQWTHSYGHASFWAPKWPTCPKEFLR